MPSILCFGDSNTWGANPNDGSRYSRRQRWPTILADKLGPAYEVIEAGQPGRTTVHEDPYEGDRNGMRHLRPILESHIPDLVLVLLGTNDLKAFLNQSAYDIARGAARIVQEIQSYQHASKSSPAEVILLTPPAIHEIDGFSDMFKGGALKSQQLAHYYQQQAQELGCRYLDLGQIVASCPKEGIHWQATEHIKLADVLQPIIMDLFESNAHFKLNR
ncbi:G-D-S-L family lipolytic protein [Alginatibacterium sediminis]|uniref:G-D-S-L family lipolytic protein n=1 Tax=Alginatibacterium sediminis TaxID=2164068 RepID=A0A420EGK0_9ALTE|nr:SGNH/GDSL hydrolase family protein [Alginatibacterium sediminis]RKF19790.1 G-D-S-L family lipolytic protein [Alginatibacterium sediminis]